MNKNILYPVITAIIVAALAFVWDWNTTDNEVLPTIAIQQERLDIQQEQLQEQKQVTEELEQGIEGVSRYVLREDIKDLTRELRNLDQRRDNWTQFDKEQYEQMNESLDSAYEVLESLDEAK